MPIEFGEVVARGFSYRHEGELIARERSAFQQIAVFDTPSFGRVLELDGLLQTTERDEFCYHEMLVHVPLVLLEAPRRVLIIGGGDGGSLRHALMHPVERVVMCEIDERVSVLCRELMPGIAGDAWDDPRAEVLFDDGIAYMRNATEKFDAIIVDSSDPIGPGEGLFTEAFYRDAAAHLAPGGVVCVQSGSPFFQQDECHRAHRNMASALPDVRTYLGHVPTYPGTAWSYTVGGERIVVDAAAAAERARARGLVTRYWTPELQAAAFALNRIAAEVVAPEGPPHTWGRSPEEASHADVPRG